MNGVACADSISGWRHQAEINYCCFFQRKHAVAGYFGIKTVAVQVAIIVQCSHPLLVRPDFGDVVQGGAFYAVIVSVGGESAQLNG